MPGDMHGIFRLHFVPVNLGEGKGDWGAAGGGAGRGGGGMRGKSMRSWQGLRAIWSLLAVVS